ncbi:MAG: GNAT family N-acetyltransferase [Rhizobiaceae bacterium]|jgi:GNAT superfamily N-acetyltransferase|nr:GNAT family N-acetyltransferase [Rhizobiaceae bacterium]
MAEPFQRPAVLSGVHLLDGFDCSEPSLDEWLKTRARYNQAEGCSQSFVVADADYVVVAFASLSAGLIDRNGVPRRFKTGQAPKSIPVAVLGRLAVDVRHQGRGLGAALLKHMIGVSVHAAGLIGFRAIVVDPLDEKAAAFYERYGFEPMQGGQGRMLLPVKKLMASRMPD